MSITDNYTINNCETVCKVYINNGTFCIKKCFILHIFTSMYTLIFTCMNVHNKHTYKRIFKQTYMPLAYT